MPVQADGPDDYKAKYTTLKRKLKLLIYENECFQEELRKAQRSLLRDRRDKSFLLDRLLHYHRGPDSSSDSDQTQESDQEERGETKSSCKKRLSLETVGNATNTSQTSASKQPIKKKKTNNSTSSLKTVKNSKPAAAAAASAISASAASTGSSSSSSSSSSGNANVVMQANITNQQAILMRKQVQRRGGGSGNGDGQLSREELERQLAARQPINDPFTVSLTLPNQLFSDNILEGDFLEEEVETSPSYIEEDVTVDFD